MIHNLTPNQLKGLRWLVAQVKDANIEESFGVGYDAPIFVGERETKFVVGDVAREIYLVAPDYLTLGVLNALVASHGLVFDSKNGIYTLTRKAYEITAFDFDNPEPDPINSYMKVTYRLIKKHFNREELEGLCLELDVNPDWVFGDKTDWPLYLLRYLYRQSQLLKLTPILQEVRSGIDWPPYPG